MPMVDPASSSPPPSGPISWSSLLNLKCADAARLLAESMDRPLQRRERFFLSLHLMLCKWCRRYRVQIQFIRRVIIAFCAADALSPTTLPPAARQRIARALEGS